MSSLPIERTDNFTAVLLKHQGGRMKVPIDGKERIALRTKI